MNFPTITRYNWMCCSIILVFLALGSPEPLQAQENQKERITIQVKNQPIQKVFDDLSKQTGLKFFYGEAIANRNVLQSAKPPVHLFKTKRFYFEVLFQNEASLLEQNQTAFKWTSNPI